MLVRLPSLKLIRLWAMVLLATIGLQAAAPAAPSVQKVSGSAFSATTVEVALYAQRGDQAERQAVAPQPLAPPVAAVQVLPTYTPIRAVEPAPRPDSTGPPLYDSQSWKPAPRAPPRA